MLSINEYERQNGCKEGASAKTDVKRGRGIAKRRFSIENVSGTIWVFYSAS